MRRRGGGTAISERGAAHVSVVTRPDQARSHNAAETSAGGIPAPGRGADAAGSAQILRPASVASWSGK